MHAFKAWKDVAIAKWLEHSTHGYMIGDLTWLKVEVWNFSGLAIFF